MVSLLIHNKLNGDTFPLDCSSLAPVGSCGVCDHHQCSTSTIDSPHNDDTLAERVRVCLKMSPEITGPGVYGGQQLADPVGIHILFLDQDDQILRGTGIERHRKKQTVRCSSAR